MTTILTEIVSLLTSGITTMAGAIGTGLQELVEAIFLAEGGQGLSVFGGVVVIFAGIALAIGLCRWVTNWLTSLGN